MNRSETLNKLAPALLSAQKQIDKVIKTDNNPYYKSKYAGLPSVIEACKPQLNAAGIVVVQSNGKDEHGQYVETTLLHESGEWVNSRTYLILAKQDMQGLGSAITYSRRFDISALVFLAADDDDGNTASGNKEKVVERPGGFKAVASVVSGKTSLVSSNGAQENGEW